MPISSGNNAKSFTFNQRYMWRLAPRSIHVYQVVPTRPKRPLCQPSGWHAWDRYIYYSVRTIVRVRTPDATPWQLSPPLLGACPHALAKQAYPSRNHVQISYTYLLYPSRTTQGSTATRQRWFAVTLIPYVKKSSPGEPRGSLRISLCIPPTYYLLPRHLRLT